MKEMRGGKEMRRWEGDEASDCTKVHGQTRGWQGGEFGTNVTTATTATCTGRFECRCVCGCPNRRWSAYSLLFRFSFFI